MPEGDRELLWRHREEIGNRIVVEPQPHRIGQYELPHSVRAQRGEFSTDHTTHGMAYDVHRLQVQGIEQVVVVNHHVKHVINMLNTRARLKAWMRRGIDRKVLSKLDQKVSQPRRPPAPWRKSRGVPLPSVRILVSNMPLRTVTVFSSTPFLPCVCPLRPTIPICYYSFSILSASGLVKFSPCAELWYGSTLPG